jgi:hypothetical protein
MRNAILALLCSTLLAGCSLGSAIVSGGKELLGNDLKRTGEIAGKYNKPEVKLCTDFLQASLDSEDANLAQLEELLNEETDGVLSLTLKGILIKELTQSLHDPVRIAQFEKGFDASCSQVAGKLLINIIRDGRKAAQRMRG